MTTVKNRKRMQSVKIAFKAALLLPVLLSAACSITSVPGGVYTDFDVRDKVWAVSGFSAPKGYQEIIDLHYDSLPDNDTLGLVCAELLFTDDSLTIVYPSGAYRSMGYSLDGKSHTAVFDGVLVYGSYDAEDVRSCRYSCMTFMGGHYLSFYMAADETDVHIDRCEWRISTVQTAGRRLTPLYRIDGRYGSHEKGNTLGIEDGALWSNYCIAGEALFPRTEAYDLATIYDGPAWCLPSPAQARLLLDKCKAARYKARGKLYVGFYYTDEGSTLLLPAPEENTEYGIWLNDGSALVYQVDEHATVKAHITNDTSGRLYYIMPVRKQM